MVSTGHSQLRNILVLVSMNSEHIVADRINQNIFQQVSARIVMSVVSRMSSLQVYTMQQQTGLESSMISQMTRMNVGSEQSMFNMSGMSRDMAAIQAQAQREESLISGTMSMSLNQCPPAQLSGMPAVNQAFKGMHLENTMEVKRK